MVLMIVVGIMAVIMIAGIIYSFHHFGGETPKQKKKRQMEAAKRLIPQKKLENKVIEIKTVYISGMDTEEDKKLVTGHIDRLIGAACAASIPEKKAEVWLDRPLMDSEIIVAVGLAGYKVTEIDSREPLSGECEISGGYNGNNAQDRRYGQLSVRGKSKKSS